MRTARISKSACDSGRVVRFSLFFRDLRMLTTDEYVSHIREAAAYIRGRLQGKTAEIAVVLGSGLSTFAQHLQDATVECLQVSFTS